MPVPPSTVSRIIDAIVAAVRAETARPSSSGFGRTTIEPFGETIRSITCGSITRPLFAIPAATIAIWSGVTSRRSWPNAKRPASTSESSLGSNSSPPS